VSIYSGTFGIFLQLFFISKTFHAQSFIKHNKNTWKLDDNKIKLYFSFLKRIVLITPYLVNMVSYEQILSKFGVKSLYLIYFRMLDCRFLLMNSHFILFSRNIFKTHLYNIHFFLSFFRMKLECIPKNENFQ